MNVGLDPVTHVFYSDMYNSCQFNPKVAHFTDAFYMDRGGHGSVKDVGSINIYANIGTAILAWLLFIISNVHSNSTCHIFKFCLEFFIHSLIFFSSY